MKRYLLTAVAALALAGPLAISSALAQPGQGRDNRPDYQGAPQQTQAPDSRDNDYRDRREAWRDTRADTRWDDSRYNGYYENERWTYGQPSADRFGRPGFSLGYRPWAVGQNLGYYSTRFQTVDYRQENLRRPIRGSRWVRDDRGDFLLVTRAGRISAVVISGNQPRDRRSPWRDSNSDRRWDDSRHNGYYSNDRWTYGQPPAGARVTLGYKPWQRGEQLGYYNGRYTEVDYRSNSGLREPPRGYHWVRSDSGDYLLAAIAGGLIAQVILNGSR
jgi:Ni/Co efflux regulator RcnB